jgi:hypothetical protein
LDLNGLIPHRPIHDPVIPPLSLKDTWPAIVQTVEDLPTDLQRGPLDRRQIQFAQF